MHTVYICKVSFNLYIAYNVLNIEKNYKYNQRNDKNSRQWLPLKGGRDIQIEKGHRAAFKGISNVLLLLCVHLHWEIWTIFVFTFSIFIIYLSVYGLPWWLSGKESACNAGDAGSIPGSGRSPGEGNWLPTPVFLPGESHGQRSLAGYSPWGCQELDMTERLILSNVYTKIS